jgi:hypothetical protein
MVPRHAFQAGEETQHHPDHAIWRADPAGFVDTGYACRHDTAGKNLVITGPPPGIISAGGQRLSLRELQDSVRRISPDSTVAALPDALAGHRLAGVAGDADRARALFTAAGANALVVDAFRTRRNHAG